MEIWKDPDQLHLKNPVVTVGIFDGVHMGHSAILDRTKEVAAGIEGETVVITFWPHPRVFLTDEGAGLKFLNTLSEKKELLKKKGIDHFIILPFTREFSNHTAEEFFSDILVHKVRTRHLIVGYNHRFGRDRLGDFDALIRFAGKYGVGVEQVEAKSLDGDEISSTRIREALESGNTELANRLLGYAYFLDGTIIGGKKIGRSLGFPTANILPKERYKLIPKDGVYAVRITLAGRDYNGMLNIGIRPTVNNGEEGRTIEVHILSFDQQIYGQEVTLRFIDRIRDEQKFDHIDQLRQQLTRDREAALKILARES